jgi:hypothetical protein
MSISSGDVRQICGPKLPFVILCPGRGGLRLEYLPDQQRLHKVIGHCGVP